MGDKRRQLEALRKRTFEHTLSGALDEGPQPDPFEMFTRGLGESAGATDDQGLPTSSKDAQIRALKATLGIGAQMLGIADPADLVVSEAARKAAAKMGFGETGQSIAEVIAGLASGLGAGDLKRAGVFLTRTGPFKEGGKVARDAAARELKRDPFWKKNTRAGDLMRKFVYEKDPRKGIRIDDRQPNALTGGSIGTTDPDTGMISDVPEMLVPSGPDQFGNTQYTPGSLGKVMGHERKHHEINKLRERMDSVVDRVENGGAPMTADEHEGMSFLIDWERAAKKSPYRPKGNPIRTALDESEVELGGTVIPQATRQDVIKQLRDFPKYKQTSQLPHGPDEAMADLGAVYTDPGIAEYTSQKTRDLMKRWLEPTSWKASEPGNLRDVLEQIK